MIIAGIIIIVIISGAIMSLQYNKELDEEKATVLGDELLIAVAENNISKAQELIIKGAVLNSVNSEGRRPIHIASNNLEYAMTKLLLESGAEVNSTTDYGTMALQWASYYTNGEETVNLLIENGADLNAKNNSGNTALHMVLKIGTIKKC